MAASRRPNDADAMRIDLPLRGIGAHETNGPGGIFEHPRMTIALRAKAVLYDKGGNSVCHKPIGVTLAFVRRERAITAARQNHHRGTRCDNRVRRKKGS